MTSARNRVLLASLLILGIALVPIWSVTYPPLTDYPNHLARMYILMKDGADRFLNDYYVIRWAAIPNLAMDLIVPTLGRFFGVLTAGKLFLSAILILLFTGTLALHRAIHQTWSPWPLAAALLLFNPFFLWGFVNYLFGLGLAIWLSALWIRFRDKPLAWVVFPPAALGLFFMHLMPFGIYLVTITAYEASIALQHRADVSTVAKRGAQLALQALPALGVFLAASPTRGGATGALFSELGPKFRNLAYMFENYVPFLDFDLTFVPLVVLSATLIAMRRLKIDRRMMLSLGALVLIYFALPNNLLSAGGAYRRFSLPLALLFVASTSLELRGRKMMLALAFAMSGLFLTRVAVLERVWLHRNIELAQLRDMLWALPRGARLVPLSFFPGNVAYDYRTHFACMAVIDRDAFVPSIFAFPRQQPVLFSKRAVAIAHGALPAKIGFGNGEAPDWHALNGYDYALLIDRRYLREPLPNDLKEVATTGDFQLFKLPSLTR